MPGRTENIRHRTRLDNVTFVYNSDILACIAHHFHLVRNHHHCEIHSCMDFLNQVQNFVSRLRVERTRRFVAKKNVRPRRQGTCNRHALFLTARKCCNRRLLAVFKAHKRKHLFDASVDIAAVPTCKFQRERHILACRARTEQIKILENHSDFEPTAVQLFFWQMVHTNAIVIDLAPIGSF